MLSRNVLALLIPVVVVSACSDSGTSESASSVSVSTSVETSSTVASTTTSTIAPTTIAPTTTLARPSAESLFFVMPGPTDLPSGWTTAGGMPSAAITPAQGPGKGNCGGPNLDHRAEDAGVLAVMSSPDLTTSDGGEAGFTVYAFASSNQAAELMKATVEQIQCPFFEYELVEGTGPGFFDGFVDGFGDGRATWTIREGLSVGGVDVADAAGAFQLKLESEYLSTFRGYSYGWRSTGIAVYEQHDRFVFVSTLYGECCVYGYSNTATSVSYTPSLETLLDGLKVLRPKVLERLRDASLI